jgi:glycosyltransferase involved in cell wall biosynthesis
MKKIAYCLISDGMGGAENIVLQTLEFLKNDNRFFLIVNNELANNFKNVLPPERILNIGDIYIHKKYRPIKYVLNNRFYNLRKALIDCKLTRIAKFVELNSIEFIHAHLDYALYLGLRLKSKQNSNLKVIFTVHSSFGFDNSKDLKPQLPFRYIDFSQVDNFIFVSRYVYEIYSKEFAIRNYQIIYNGIDTRNISSIERTYDVNDNFNILYLGGEKLVKGYDVLLDTIELLIKKEDVVNIKVFVLGVVSENGIIQQLIEQKKLNEYIQIVGFIEPGRLNEYFDASHLLFMPSRTEAMPLAAIEAVFRNLPILATVVGGIPEIVLNGRNGFCTRFDSIEFSEKIYEMMRTYTSLIDETKAYNNQIKHSFALEYMCSSLVSLYDSLCVNYEQYINKK